MSPLPPPCPLDTRGGRPGAHQPPHRIGSASQVDSYGGAWGALRGGGDAPPVTHATGCEPTDELVSVHAWPGLLRSRPHCLSARTRVVLRGGGPHMPIFGLGTGGSDDDEAVIAAAIRAGYALLDMGELYENEALVGRAVRRSGVHREALFLSSKVGHWCTSPPPAALLSQLPPQYRNLGALYPTSRGTVARAVCVGGAAETRLALLASLRRLEVSYLDLYLLHWPLTDAAYELHDPAHAAVRLDAWRALVELKREGLVRAIGVSNFSPRQMEPLLTIETPAVLQLELHPLLQRRELRAFCAEHGILLQAYTGAYKPELREHPELARLARGVPVAAERVPHPAAILSMRWTLQAGAAIIPRSRRQAYVGTNLQVFSDGFARLLPPSAMEALSALDRNTSLYGLHEIFVSDLIA